MARPYLHPRVNTCLEAIAWQQSPAASAELAEQSSTSIVTTYRHAFLQMPMEIAWETKERILSENFGIATTTPTVAIRLPHLGYSRRTSAIRKAYWITLWRGPIPTLWGVSCRLTRWAEVLMTPNR
jgi:hypothetical protein